MRYHRCRAWLVRFPSPAAIVVEAILGGALVGIRVNGKLGRTRRVYRQFSFGLILYELVAGRRAFHRGSAAETTTAIIREEPEPLPSSAPAALRWIVARCRAKEPAERYVSVAGYINQRAPARRVLEWTHDGAAGHIADADIAERRAIREGFKISVALRPQTAANASHSLGAARSPVA
jgi:hypothetical protein